MYEKTVSIIVPVYNVEKYIGKCIESLQNQVYKNLEIILCDDGSLDQCPQICDYYANKDKRIKVLHQDNGGIGSARNAGLNIASGEYICFVDGDDFVCEEYINTLVEIIESNNADIGVCGFACVYTDGEKCIEIAEGDYSAEEYLRLFLYDWKCCLVWNKLFRREVLNTIQFDESHILEDEFFTYKTVMQANKISVINVALYKYRQRKSGIMASAAKEAMLLSRLDYTIERFELVTKYYPNLLSDYLENFSNNMVRYAKESYMYDDVFYKVQMILKKYFGKILFGNIHIRSKYFYLKELLCLKKKRGVLFEEKVNHQDEKRIQNNYFE